MALTNVYVQVYGQLPEFFRRISEGQAPEQFTIQHLKDLGYTSANHRAFIPLLKALGFLSAEGAPTKRYHDHRDSSQSARVMAQALHEAYSDLFVIKAHPTEADRPLIEGKFKSAHNVSDRLAKLMANTFYSLLGLADLQVHVESKEKVAKKEVPAKVEKPEGGKDEKQRPILTPPGLHYNIQIHLPATKDIEVYNAIFKSLKEHLIE